MNENISESNSNQKGIKVYPNNINIIKSQEIEKTNIQKIPKKIRKINSNKRYHTPISHRFKTQQNLGANNITSTSYSNLISDNNPSFRKNGHENNYYHDALYYKNLYIQTKNNLDKEKRKKHDNNHRKELSFNYYMKENSMLKEKINSLTFQLDRVINLVEKSQDQNSKNMNIKQGEIKKLNEEIESLRKNNSLIQVKSQEEIETLNNTITKLNSNNQNTQLAIKNYQNKIEHINQMSNNEINILKEQIASLNKNLNLCINEKNKNDQKSKEIIQE
jgi:chromosome segregation ATPase